MSRKGATLEWLDETGSSARGRALGTDVAMVVTEPAMLPRAKMAVAGVVDDLDATCSRFRPDSELSRLNARTGVPIRVSELLARALAEALRAAETTDGAVDPTMGSAMRAIGYDVDFAAIQGHNTTEPARSTRSPAPGVQGVGQWRAIWLDGGTRTVVLPHGTEIDLGATAKALAADLAAAAVMTAIKRGGVLVSLGGDIAVAGTPPDGGWVIQVAEDSADAPISSAERIALDRGGVASSSTELRAWTRNGRRMHHILDPRTGMPARSAWRLTSVVAPSCVDANIASTAAVVRGRDILPWLAARNLPARLVGTDGSIMRMGGWPEAAVGEHAA